MHLQAFGDLLRNYGKVFSAAWANRQALEPVPRVDHELAFLPASLELVERPVHPAPRWTMTIISLLSLLAAGLTVLGQLEVVVSARGKVMPGSRVKVVQPALTGVVRRILVTDGQKVTAGELLVELDSTQANADELKAHSSRVTDALAMARATALLAAVQSGVSPRVSLVESASTEQMLQAQRLCEGAFREYQDKLTGAQANVRRREAELQSVHHQIAKLRATAPLARQQANDFQALLERKYVTRTEYLDKEASARQQEHELDVQLSRVHELESGIAAQQAELATIASQFRREQLDAMERARHQLAQEREDETKARTRRELTGIRAPASGSVQQLAVHTLGGVVSAGQMLMEIVPADAVEVEATIENKDIGFVKAGQPVSVKVEAFPYTRYGTLPGVVKFVSGDAVQDKRTGLSFVAHIQLPVSAIQVDGHAVHLSSGMAVTAEVMTGKRSVASYLLDPFVQTAQESMRER